MKYHTDDGRKFRSLGRAIEHAEQSISADEKPVYWRRQDEIGEVIDGEDDNEAYIGYAIGIKPENIGEKTVVSKIVRKSDE